MIGHINYETWNFKIRVFPYIYIVEDNLLLHSTNVWENHDFHDMQIAICDPFEILMNYYRPSYLVANAQFVIKEQLLCLCMEQIE